jgi:hypothetical protein
MKQNEKQTKFSQALQQLLATFSDLFGATHCGFDFPTFYTTLVIEQNKNNFSHSAWVKQTCSLSSVNDIVTSDELRWGNDGSSTRKKHGKKFYFHARLNSN